MANQIKTFGMSRMSIGSCCDFHTKVNACITTATPAALHVTEKATAYTAAIELLSFIVNRERAFVSTVTLAEADDTRDRGSGVIAQVVNAYLTSPVADKRAAAILLNAKMSPYRGIRKHEYTKQTAETRGMLAMLDAEAEAVATLGLTEEVEAVREANAAFDTEFQKKTEEMSARMVQSDVKSEDAVAEANALYQDIVQTVNAYAIVQPTDEINSFIASGQRKRLGGHLFGDSGQLVERRQSRGRRYAGAGTGACGVSAFYSPQITRISKIIVGAYRIRPKTST